MKFTTESLKDTAAGKLLQNKKAIESVQHKKKAIAKGYEQGWIIVGGDRPMYVRSRWEANLVYYFEFLKQQGKIKAWYYESETFYFEGLKRGTNNYKPDFKIIENDGTSYFIEVKGYFTRKDYVKITRMRKYHPNIGIKILTNDKGLIQIRKDYPNLKFDIYASYDMIAEKSYLVKGWNSPFKKKEEVQHLIPLPMKRPKKVKKNKTLFD